MVTNDRHEPADRMDTPRAAAALRWGSGRAESLAPALRRMAEALATVSAFPLDERDEPFPTGPLV